MCTYVMLISCHFKRNNCITHDCTTYWCTQNYCPTVAQSLKVTVSWYSARLTIVVVCIRTPVYAYISTHLAYTKARVVQPGETTIMYCNTFATQVRCYGSKCAMDYHLVLMKRLTACSIQDKNTCDQSWNLWAFCCLSTRNH